MSEEENGCARQKDTPGFAVEENTSEKTEWSKC